MFDRFSASLRSVVFRARDSAASEGQQFVGPAHILSSLIELHPELFEKLASCSSDAQMLQRQLLPLTTTPRGFRASSKVKFDEHSIRVMRLATEEALLCWERWEVPRRAAHAMDEEDIRSWEARFRQTIEPKYRRSRLLRWATRRNWEVDERHLLLGLLKDSESPAAKLLINYGLTLEMARERLCVS